MMDAAELRLERAAFEQWLQGEGGDNRAELDRLKRALPVVLAECVTETQRQYILHYFVDRMTQKQIGERYGKNPATVSRTIHRGLDRMYRYLRFVSPAFIQAPNRRSYLKNR